MVSVSCGLAAAYRRCASSKRQVDAKQRQKKSNGARNSAGFFSVSSHPRIFSSPSMGASSPWHNPRKSVERVMAIDRPPTPPPMRDSLENIHARNAHTNTNSNTDHPSHSLPALPKISMIFSENSTDPSIDIHDYDDKLLSASTGNINSNPRNISPIPRHTLSSQLKARNSLPIPRSSILNLSLAIAKAYDKLDCINPYGCINSANIFISHPFRDDGKIHVNVSVSFGGKINPSIYLAPEFSIPGNLPGDIYALGIVFWEIASISNRNISSSIADPASISSSTATISPLTFSKIVSNHIGDAFIQLIQKCCHINPQNRPHTRAIIAELEGIISNGGNGNSAKMPANSSSGNRFLSDVSAPSTPIDSESKPKSDNIINSMPPHVPPPTRAVPTDAMPHLEPAKQQILLFSELSAETQSSNDSQVKEAISARTAHGQRPESNPILATPPTSPPLINMNGDSRPLEKSFVSTEGGLSRFNGSYEEGDDDDSSDSSQDETDYCWTSDYDDNIINDKSSSRKHFDLSSEKTSATAGTISTTGKLTKNRSSKYRYLNAEGDEEEDDDYYDNGEEGMPEVRVTLEKRTSDAVTTMGDRYFTKERHSNGDTDRASNENGNDNDNDNDNSMSCNILFATNELSEFDLAFQDGAASASLDEGSREDTVARLPGETDVCRDGCR